MVDGRDHLAADQPHHAAPAQARYHHPDAFLRRAIFSSDFGLFLSMTKPGMLYETTSTIDTYVYRGLLEDNNIGRASAATFIQSIMGFILVLVANLTVRRFEKENALF